MGKYKVNTPGTSYVKGSKVIFHSKASEEPVDIDDAVAGKLGDAVERVGGGEEQPAEEQAAEQPKSRGRAT